MSGLRRKLISGFRITSFATLLSRVLGMIRDILTASLFGTTAGGLLDIFVVAFRVPDFFRRLFGEGVLTSTYVPRLSQKVVEDRDAANRLVGICLVGLIFAALAVVLVTESLLVVMPWLLGRPVSQHLFSLSTLLLPYIILICIVAQLASTLRVCKDFATPALVPCVLNILWIAGLGLASWLSQDDIVRLHVLALSILASGMIQVAIQWRMLTKYHLRPIFSWNANRSDLWIVAKGIPAAVLGLAVTQINSLSDGLMAWWFTKGAITTPSMWFANSPPPLKPGAVAVIYYGERLYMFPLGLIGVAIAVVVYPLLSEAAALGDRRRLARDLATSLRLVLWLGLPASAGMALLAEPLVQLLFERGNFTPQDTIRTGWTIVGYAIGVWAYCALPVLVRGFYATENFRTPALIAAPLVVLNIILNCLFVWHWQEAGLAFATSVCAVAQVYLLLWRFSAQGPIAWSSLNPAIARFAVATAVMVAAGIGLRMLPVESRLLRVAIPLVGCGVLYMAVCWAMGSREIQEVIRIKQQKRKASASPDSPPEPRD